jgi:hypothetical protein
LYRHFKDKEDIMVNILKFMRDSMKSGAKWLDKLPGIEALGRLLGHIAEFAYKNPEMLETIHRIRMSQKYDNLSEEKLELDGGPDNHGLKFVEKGQVEGNIRNDIPSKYLSMMAFGTLFLLMRRWYLSGRSFDLVAEWKPVWMSLKKILENTED